MKRGLTLRARRGKGGIAASIVADALAKKIDGNLARLLNGGATDEEAMTVKAYLALCEQQMRAAQS